MVTVHLKAILAVQGLLTHLHTPAASCEILKTEQHPPHSYHILKLRQSNNKAQKTLSHEWDKQTPQKRKTPPRAVCATKRGWYDLWQTQAFQLHKHHDVIYLWPCAHTLDVDGARRYSAMLHMVLGTDCAAAPPKWQKHAVTLLITCWRSKLTHSTWRSVWFTSAGTRDPATQQENSQGRTAARTVRENQAAVFTRFQKTHVAICIYAFAGCF